MNTQTIRLHRLLRCPPDRLYRAFIEPEAFAKWLPPFGFSARVHEMDARVGGAWRMSFINHATGHSHSFGGRYLELQAGARVRYTAVFDDPGLPGEMQTSAVLTHTDFGTDLQIEQSGVPPQIPAPACYLGWQESLLQLAQLVEAQTGG